MLVGHKKYQAMAILRGWIYVSPCMTPISALYFTVGNYCCNLHIIASYYSAGEIWMRELIRKRCPHHWDGVAAKAMEYGNTNYLT